ncbi:MAG: hypothetical protein ABIR36_03825, partial [Nitrospiraceae bacterium]
AMTTDVSRFGFLGALFWIAWMMIVFCLLWAYASKGQVRGKDMLVRSLLTVLLLLALQIAALGITFILYMARPSTHPDMTQDHHVVPPRN